MTDLVRVGTPRYRNLLDQHEEFVALKGVRVSVSRAQLADDRRWAELCWENAGRPQGPAAGHWITTDRHWIDANLKGIIGARVVQRLTGGTLTCTPDKKDPGYDLILHGLHYDVKSRQAFLTPRMVCWALPNETFSPSEPDIRAGIDQILVNPIPNSDDVMVCGVIDRAKFFTWMFPLELNGVHCFAVTAQPLRPIGDL